MHVGEEAAPPPMTVASRQGDYTVDFKASILEAWESLDLDSETFFVVDRNVYDLHEESLEVLTGGYPTLLLTADEVTKSLDGVRRLVDWLIENRAVKSAKVVAIGGGCIQDLVSFTSHLYYRGIDWAFMPTTVLSQADSCIGAKSGINVLPYKNQLGVLHSPRHVVLCSEFLSTLPYLEVASGYGEIVKLAVTSSRHFLDDLEAYLATGGLRNPHLLDLESAALAAKREVIEADEYESDLRRILNYGHSFGHALEAVSGHEIPHGLAVLWGIDVINALGMRWGLTDPEIAYRLRSLIDRYFEFTLPATPTADELVAMLKRDKKVVGGTMNFVVLRDVGELVIVPKPLDEHLIDDVSAILHEQRVFARH